MATILRSVSAVGFPNLAAGDLTTAEAHVAEAMPLAEAFDLGPMLADLLQVRAQVAVAGPWK